MLENLKPILIVILPVLIIAYITIRYTETKKKREKYNEEYSNFRGVLLDFINADLPHKKWTIFSISLTAAQIQAENSSSTPSVTVLSCKNA